MKLYQYPGGDGLSSISPPCMKVELALRLLGAEYEVVNLRSLPKVKSTSVTERLPVLEVDGQRICDSIAILDELERRFPDADLFPSDPVARTNDRLWEHFANDSLYWSGYYLRWIHPEGTKNFQHALFGRAPFYVRWVVAAAFTPRQQKRAKMHGHGLKAPEAIWAEMERGVDMIATGLAGGPYLQGREHPGRGDLACASLLVQAGFARCLPQWVDELQQRPEITGYVARVMNACDAEPPAWIAEPAAAKAT